MSKRVRESVAAYGAAIRPITVREFYLGAKKGVFGEDEKLELIWGEVVQLSPQQSRHSTLVAIARNLLQKAFPDGALFDHSPFRLDRYNEPEPDVLVAKGSPSDYMDRHPGPADALLVLEVADSSLRKDRLLKTALYATFEIPEYWILDVKGKRLEVYRDPQKVGEKGQYKTILTLERGDFVAPLNAPEHRIAITDLIPGH